MPATFMKPTELPVLSNQFHSPQCGTCGLYKTCRSPKMEPSGMGRRKIVVVAEAPGADEDNQGVQLVGNSGQELMKVMSRHGIDMRRDCILTNALICRPPGNEIKNARAIDWCRPNVIRTIREYDPQVIILLGAVACQSVIGWLWNRNNSNVGGVGRWAGYRIPDQTLNAWVCPTYHPAHILREKSPIYEMAFDRHIAEAAALQGRPFQAVPDYRKAVEVILDPKAAGKRVLDIIKRQGTIAFDFETNMLKPEHPRSRIVSCSVCWEGKETIAYPWTVETAAATKLLLTSPKVKKIGWNVPFEQRWCINRLGYRVRNWRWDGQLTAHALDNGGKGRPVTGLDFQAYVHLGAKDYYSRITPYLKTKIETNGGYSENRIHEADLYELLIYNGIDSLLEYLMAENQTRRMGLE